MSATYKTLTIKTQSLLGYKHTQSKLLSIIYKPQLPYFPSSTSPEGLTGLNLFNLYPSAK